jgi:transglutaminase-like putative cysteine protease
MRLIASAGAAACAGLAFHPVFGWADLLPVVLPAAALPSVIAWLLGSRPLWTALLANVLAWTAAVLVLFHGPVAPSSLAGGLGNGWRTILATVPPLPGRPELLLLVLTCTWLAALIGAEIVARSRHPVLSALPAIAVTGLAGVLATGPTVYVVGGLALMTGLLTLRRVAGLAPLAACVAIAMVAMPLMPWPSRFDARQRMVQPEPRLTRAISPLDLIAPWLRSPDRELFSVRSAQAGNWRLAVFDTFNGATWSSSAVFQPTGGAVPFARRGTSRTDQITIASLPGPWLPAADRPTSIAGIPVQVDPATGVLISTGNLQPGVHYDVRSTVSEPDPATLRTAAAATGAVTLPSGDGVAELRQAAQEATSGAAYPYQQAALLEKHLRETFSYDTGATPGHNLRSLHLFVATTQRGTSEQFATAYAVMARTLGLPSRVVVGFRPGLRQADTWHVRTGDVLAWPEINFAGVGWVPFFPTPDRAGQAASDGQSTAVSPRRQELNRQVVQEAERQPLTPPTTAPAAEAAPPTPARQSWTWLYLLVAPVLYLTLVVSVPGWRLRRQRRLSAPDQIAAAWRRANRRLTPLLGDVPDKGSLTNSELACAGIAALGEASRIPLTTLATLADQSHFSTELLTPRLAALAWERLRTLERLISRHTSFLRRLDPRRFTD